MQSNTISKKLAIIGAGFMGGQPKHGVEEGPISIRSAKLDSNLQELGWEIENFDITFESVEECKTESNGNVKNSIQVGSACKNISNIVAEQSSKGKVCLTLGGDHSIAIGTISGICKTHKDVFVVWVDAHADINTPKTTLSGNIHGMPVAFLMGLIEEKVPGFEWLKPCLTPERIIYIGLRDVDPGEKLILRKHGIKVFSMTEVDRYGIGRVMEMILDYIGNKPIHLSFDVDGADPSAFPSTGTDVRGGLSLRESNYICHSLAQTGSLVGMDIVEVNPQIGTTLEANLTAENSVSLAKFALGNQLW